MVVEEPGEEPRLYRQDTGELVTNGKYAEPFLRGENDEHPNDLPKGKEKAKYQSDKSKIYKDIDELIEKLIKDDASFKSSKETKPPTSTSQSYKPIPTVKTSVTPTPNLNSNINNSSFSYNKKANSSINNNDLFRRASSTLNKDDRSLQNDLSTSRSINKKDNIKKSESFSRSESIKVNPIHHSIHLTTPTAPFPTVKSKPIIETINPIKDNEIPVKENKKLVETTPVPVTTDNKDDTLIDTLEQTILNNVTLRSKEKVRKSESTRKRSSEKSNRSHHGHHSHHHRHRSSSAKSNSRRSKHLQVIDYFYTYSLLNSKRL